MTALKPPLVRSFARDSWWWVPAIADITAPTDDEINAPTGVNVSCQVLGEQDQPTATTAKVTLPRLNCEEDVVEVAGETTHAIPDFRISFNPQGAAGSDGVKAWEALDDGDAGFLVRRQAKPASDDAAVGDFVDIWPASLGVKVPTRTSGGADGVYVFNVGMSATTAPAFHKAVVAGA